MADFQTLGCFSLVKNCGFETQCIAPENDKHVEASGCLTGKSMVFQKAWFGLPPPPQSSECARLSVGRWQKTHTQKKKTEEVFLTPLVEINVPGTNRTCPQGQTVQHGKICYKQPVLTLYE